MAVMDAFSSIIGQTQAIALLKSAILRDRIAPAYLFTGTEGIGRSLVAQAFAEVLVQDPKSRQRVKDRNHPDVMWVEPTYLDKGKLLTAKEAEAAGLKRRAAPQIRLEQIREVGNFLSHLPLESQRSIVIIQEAQTMAESPANGLLKTLEEPGQATIILIAPDVTSLLPTLISRCQRIPFYRLTNEQLRQVLTGVGYADLPDQILNLAQGSPGTAIAAYQQFQTINPELLRNTEQLPQTPRAALALAKQIAKDLDTESQIWLIDYLENYFWQQSALKFYSNLQVLTLIMQILEDVKQQISSYVQPRLAWEVALLKIALDRLN